MPRVRTIAARASVFVVIACAALFATMFAARAQTQQLIDAAKRQGELTVYSALTTEDNAALIGGFEKKYGIKVKLWRASSETLLRRIVSEAGARRYDVDAVLSSGSGLEPLHREKLLQPIKSPLMDGRIPGALLSHREWTLMLINPIVQAYNTRMIKADSLPHSYRDLLRPEWKGKLGVEAEDFDWFATVIAELGETEGLQLFRDIASGNGISVRGGHALLTNMVVAGEVPLALTVYSYLPSRLKAKDLPI